MVKETIMGLENIPSPEWQEMYFGLRSEDTATREAATQTYLNSMQWVITPAEFIAMPTVEPFEHPDGGTIWVDLSQNKMYHPTVESRIENALSRPAKDYVVASSVDQVFVIQDDNWEYQIRCFCNLPVVAIWDRS
jgi:hypothetical protein